MTVSPNRPALSPATPTLPSAAREPSWLKVKMPAGDGYPRLSGLVND